MFSCLSCCRDSEKKTPHTTPHDFQQDKVQEIHNACKDVIVGLARSLGDCDSKLETTVIRKLEKRYSHYFNLDNTTTNVLEPSPRMRTVLFQPNTHLEIYTQNFWDISSNQIEKIISGFILKKDPRPSTPLTPSTLEEKHAQIKLLKSVERLSKTPELFIYLGFAKFQLTNILNQLKNSQPIDDSFSNHVKAYVEASSDIQSKTAGVFSLDQESSTEKTTSRQRFLLKEGSLSSIHKELVALQQDLEENYKKYPYHHQLNFKEKETLVFSNADLDNRLILSLCEKIVEIYYSQSIREDSEPDTSINIFIHVEQDGDIYILCKHRGFYRKFYIPKEPNIQMFTLGYLSYPKEESRSKSITRFHMALPGLLWPMLMEKFQIAADAINDQESEVECLRKIGQFLSLYINIHPYQKGSADIGQWLMKGFFLARGLNIGMTIPHFVSWDFCAFAHLSAEEFAETFQKLFHETQNRPS